MKNTKGFTVLELMVVAAIFIILVIAIASLFIRTINAWNLEESLNDINASSRNTQTLMFQDLIEAGALDNATVGLNGLTVLDANGDPVAQGFQGPGVRFQRPLLPTAAEVAAIPGDQNGDNVVNMIDALLFYPDVLEGLRWTDAITIRLYNEDANGNFLMDEGEDLNDNGVLESVVQRTQGDITRVIGAHVTDLAFELNGRQLDVTVTMARRLSASNQAQVNDTLSFSVVLEN